jgi:hypothetical protein
MNYSFFQVYTGSKLCITLLETAENSCAVYQKLCSVQCFTLNYPSISSASAGLSGIKRGFLVIIYSATFLIIKILIYQIWTTNG